MPRLSADQLELLDSARRVVLATTRPDGTPRLAPIAFAVRHSDRELTLYSALDEKPKSVGDVRDLARVRDIAARPRVAVLVDRWSEDWRELAWLRLDGHASLVEPGDEPSAEHSDAVELLRKRYPQYAGHALESLPVIRVAVDRVTAWSAAAHWAAR